jgi:hypothetical protein
MIFYKNKRYNGIPLIKFITLMICFGMISCSMAVDSHGSAIAEGSSGVSNPRGLINGLTPQEATDVANRMIEILNQLNKDIYWVSFLVNNGKIMWFFDTKKTVEQSYVQNFFSNFSEKFYMAFYSYYNIIKKFYGEKQEAFTQDQLNKTKEQWMKFLDESMATIKDNLNNNMIFFHLNECFFWIKRSLDGYPFSNEFIEDYEKTFGKSLFENMDENLIFAVNDNGDIKKQTTLSSKGIEFINTLLKQFQIPNQLSSGLNETTTAQQLSPEDKETLIQLLKKLIDFDKYVEKSKMIPYFGSNDEGANKPVEGKLPDDSKKQNSPSLPLDLPKNPSPMDEESDLQLQIPSQSKFHQPKKPQDQPRFQGQEKPNKLPDNSMDLSDDQGSENKDSRIFKKFVLPVGGTFLLGSAYLANKSMNGKKNKKSKSIKKDFQKRKNNKNKQNNPLGNNPLEFNNQAINNNGMEIENN